ncbi:MAG: DNA-binding protein [Hadesarchaea archaeon]|nr:MAG: DNA-binding protein [Hadesarchaea archaeon]
MEEEEIEELRRRKMLELRARVEEQQGQAEQRRQYEIQKRLAILQIMTPEARSRLANIRAAKPEFAEQLELQLIQLAQSGRLGSKITDVQLRDILSRLQARKHKFKIRRV